VKRNGVSESIGLPKDLPESASQTRAVWSKDVITCLPSGLMLAEVILPKRQSFLVGRQV
jgi:hypothetical protein